ncbi:hypothetical protein [Bacillus sp. OK048]|uniref:hypothetical protein n=1 Tax=Bacillus sp. OK048 TaxID=1882761 RepID=UPI00088CD1E4|nr:hypothetical protein [Bacillus sp. OK048]SDM23691.1 hypothetical protein SAMN05443253_102407 [Bacillus sp. OK048]
MLTIIWVLGSMLLMLLIHFLLPLGYTTKGKFIVVVTSGLLALGGLAATSTIPVGQTLLILLALSFFAAYIMDSRMAKSLYLTKEKLLEKVDFEDSDSSFILSKQTEKTLDIELMDSELEISAPFSILKTAENTISVESLDEDISFLQDRELDSKSKEVIEDTELEVGYLSDIESLLEDSIQQKVELQEEKVDSQDEVGWLDELAELTLVKDEERSPIIESELDDFELDELFADIDVAATTDNDESKTKKVLELQK